MVTARTGCGNFCRGNLPATLVSLYTIGGPTVLVCSALTVPRRAAQSKYLNGFTRKDLNNCDKIRPPEDGPFLMLLWQVRAYRQTTGGYF